MKREINIQQYLAKDTNFADLMKERIHNVLLYASHYDAFILEEDGRIDEQVFNEYQALNLRNAPRFTLATTKEEVSEQLRNNTFELIIIMPNADIARAFRSAKIIKRRYPNIPIVGLAPYAGDIDVRLAQEDTSGLDQIFCWLGNPNLLLAIVKMMEDSKNVEADIEAVGVQCIMLVEDSIHYMSYFLPLIYQFIFTQSQEFMADGLNSHERMLRMRGRPKLLICRTYEEAIETYEKYKDNMLGLVTDAVYPMDGVLENPNAGLTLCRTLIKHDRFLPIILQSSKIKFAESAGEFFASFIHKNSKTLAMDMGNAMKKQFGFGYLHFPAYEEGEEEFIVHGLRGLQRCIHKVSDRALMSKFARNEISRWLYSRALFPIAEYLRDISIDDLQDLNEARELIFNSIIMYRKIKNRGIIAEFDKDKFDNYSNFERIGNGSLGGKARGLAFMNIILKKHEHLFLEYPNVTVDIPRTVVLCSDVFDRFMMENELYPIALSDSPDDDILAAFLNADIGDELRENLEAFLHTTSSRPIAVRSSSLLEDSHYHPFAGTYSTYMISPTEDMAPMVKRLEENVKAVYASIYFKDSKQHIAACRSEIKEEKMCVVLQEVVGNNHDGWYYPSFSGVGKSLNHYPVGSEESTDGVVNIAFGLGKQIVDGGRSLRFSPLHPQKALQTSTVKLALADTQKEFYAIDINWEGMISTNDSQNIAHLPISEAESHNTLQYIASTYKYRDGMMVDNMFDKGMRVITFNNILKHNVMPLAKICDEALKMGEKEMGCPVEIEFAVKLSYTKDKPHKFFLLQIRPITKLNSVKCDKVERSDDEDVVIYSEHAIGNSIDEEVRDIIYVKTDVFDKSQTELIASEIGAINEGMHRDGLKYVLVGPGRWGSSDSWLGVPVKWSQISNAKVIVETALKGFVIPPSEGSHFFQNVMASRAGYFSVNTFMFEEEIYREAIFDGMEVVVETDFIRHVRCKKPLTVLVDGVKKRGIVRLG